MDRQPTVYDPEIQIIEGDQKKRLPSTGGSHYLKIRIFELRTKNKFYFKKSSKLKSC